MVSTETATRIIGAWNAKGQFVLEPQNKSISDETRDFLQKLLLERLSLQGICRETALSQKGLLEFIQPEYDQVARDGRVRVPPESTGLILEWIEADELWSFVGKKKNQVWVGLAMQATTRPVVAVHAGGRSEQDGKAFWAEVPEPYRSRCNAYTDEWDAYRGAISSEVHFAVKNSLEKPLSLRE